MQLCRKISIIFCLLGIAPTILSYDVDYTNQWKFVIAPYLWAINLNGNTQVGRYDVPVNQTFSDLFKHLNFGGMLYLSASKNKQGIFLDSVYSKISSSTTEGALSAQATNRYGIFAQGFTYEAYKKAFNHPGSFIVLTPYLGARETVNNTTVTASEFNLSATVSDNHTWATPIVGTQVDCHFNINWSALFFLDGGAMSSTNYNYRVSGLLGYKPTSFKTAKFYLGYQLIQDDYQTGSGIHFYKWNMSNFGPILGIAFTF